MVVAAASAERSHGGGTSRVLQDDNACLLMLMLMLMMVLLFLCFFLFSTPSKPVHCIVWAKQLFVLMFGKVEESMLYEDPVTGQSAFMDQVSDEPLLFYVKSSRCRMFQLFFFLHERGD